MKFKTKILMLIVVILSVIALSGCLESSPPISDSGVQKTSVQVPVQPNGLTIEQQNIKDRLEIDNKPGSIKHLYVISAYSGQVIIYSTVKGKVTSSAKRLSPYTVAARTQHSSGFGIDIGGVTKETEEVLEDDGTYGSSMSYLYWWDTKGVYHQMYITGGEIVQISDQPLAVKEIIMNFELTNETR